MYTEQSNVAAVIQNRFETTKSVQFESNIGWQMWRKTMRLSALSFFSVRRTYWNQRLRDLRHKHIPIGVRTMAASERVHTRTHSRIERMRATKTKKKYYSNKSINSCWTERNEYDIQYLFIFIAAYQMYCEAFTIDFRRKNAIYSNRQLCQLNLHTIKRFHRQFRRVGQLTMDFGRIGNNNYIRSPENR